MANLAPPRHAHGPTAEQVAKCTTLRRKRLCADRLIAIRPCTGGVCFVLNYRTLQKWGFRVSALRAAFSAMAKIRQQPTITIAVAPRGRRTAGGGVGRVGKAPPRAAQICGCDLNLQRAVRGRSGGRATLRAI